MPNDIDGSVGAGNPEVSQSWDQGLDDYRETIDAKGWKSSGDVLKSYTELEKAVGGDKVVLPGADTNQLEWDGWSKLGTPEDAADYAMVSPDGFEQYDTGLSDDMRKVFHDAKLTPTQAQLVHDRFVERMIGSSDQLNTAAADEMTQNETALKKEFGTAYDERIAAAKRGINEYGGEDLMGKLIAAGLGSDPDVIRAFSKVGMTLQQSGQFKDAETSGKFGTTPEAAREEIASIRANSALYDKGHAEYKVLNERLTRLTQQAFPDAG